MQCPIDGTTLSMTERQGIEIDYCPECRGVWLDRGELDKLIERAAASSGGGDRYERDERPRQDYDDRRRDEHDDWKHKKRKKRSGFLGELFEFD